jgi:RHH-type proline utilization regulon transcriptional repressor/proline dehydrogenase/delta 1-pyrroline-5-carboxylate dehydrogenase
LPDTRLPALPNLPHLRGLSEDAIANEAVNLAAGLLAEARRRETRSERAHAAKLARLMADPQGRAMTIAMTDQVFRSSRYLRIASQLTYLIRQYGVPAYLGKWERAGMWLASLLGERMPALVVPAVTGRLRKETRTVILPGEEHALRHYLQRRRSEGISLNLNQLGEAILGEEEAKRRLDAYVVLLQRPDVEYISVKISSVLSQINLLAFDDTVEEIKSRLRVLYRAAASNRFQTNNGGSVPKFVNLDMEEYRDLRLTLAAFRQTLEEDEFRHFHAGIVLQAYLPDAYHEQKDLTGWAVERVGAGGAPIKIRIVKGANLAMEKVDAALHGWNQAPYRTKAEADANYIRMLAYALQPEHARAAHLGIASHNLFDIAWGLLMRARYGTEEFAEVEMLEGMANPQARAVKGLAGGIRLYAPVAKREDFHSAISYLLRRLDENAAPDNFLHDLFDLHEGDDKLSAGDQKLSLGDQKWEHQRTMFLTAVRDRDLVFAGPQRTQDRNTEARSFVSDLPFANEPDTDWSLPCNQAWVRSYSQRWKDAVIDPVPLQVNGDLITPNLAGVGSDPGVPGRKSYRYALAIRTEVELALHAAVEAREKWAAAGWAARGRLLMRAAEVLAQRRGDLIGVMMRDTGKSAGEGDVEVSEAIDFANYYARAFTLLGQTGDDLDTLQAVPIGTVLVTPPWNFPLAIPAGGVFAALMAGNSVILKPAPESVLTGWHLCSALWDAGIPRKVLQFVPVPDDSTGHSLVTDERVSAVILTGAYDTARLFKSWKPELRLVGETSGKNSIIVTALADRDQAIRDLVRSAFGHAGQKCSAASLAVLEAEVYDSPAFLNRLRDAAASLIVGEASNLASSVTPVVREPGETLLRALTQLDEGEHWLLQPRMRNGNPQLWSPGIKLGVRRGAWFHRTECFGPVLGLMRAEDLHDAIDIANDSAFGLTGGIQSLDDREIALWSERIEVGNAYINRGTTGAIVQRQPFGGWKKSAFGTAKAGGPNYVINLCHWHQASASHGDRLKAALDSYTRAWRDYFSRDHDPSQIPGERNVFRYRRIRNVLIRVTAEEDLVDGMISVLAAGVCGVPATLSVVPGLSPRDKEMTYVSEAEAQFVARIPSFERVRSFRPISRLAHQSANAAHTLVIDVPLVLSGRLELRHYLREQSVTHTTHRYGAVAGGKA